MHSVFYKLHVTETFVYSINTYIHRALFSYASGMLLKCAATHLVWIRYSYRLKQKAIHSGCRYAYFTLTLCVCYTAGVNPGLETHLLPLVDTIGAGVDYIFILRGWLCLYLDICMAYSLLVRRRRVSSTSSPWCQLWAMIDWAAVDTEFRLVTMVIIPPPLVHRDHWQVMVVMRVSQAGAVLRAFAGVATPHSDGDDGDDYQDQQQWHDQVEGVDSTNHRLQTSRWIAFSYIFLPKPLLQTIRNQPHMLSKIFPQDKTTV